MTEKKNPAAVQISGAKSPLSGTGRAASQVKVFIQGIEGSFHQIAARKFFGEEVIVICCNTFREVIAGASITDTDTYAVMAIENSIAGSILPNYNLLHQSRMVIAGEIYLQIRHNLLAYPGNNIEDIREVHSHTMALQQCYDFLDHHPWKLVETEDTALSARNIQHDKSRHTAAIASTLAAELYGLEILASDIHTLKNNYTRFLVLQHEEMDRPYIQADKASVTFHTDHSKGSLARVLDRIAVGGINLSKLQSFPIPGTDFKYAFHADMEFDSLHQFERVIESLRSITESLRIYGEYRKGGFY